jgi:hypothetical protein
MPTLDELKANLDAAQRAHDEAFHATCGASIKRAVEIFDSPQVKDLIKTFRLLAAEFPDSVHKQMCSNVATVLERSAGPLRLELAKMPKPQAPALVVSPTGTEPASQQGT